MRQLTSLDAQFLAMETARTYGHVGGLAVYDPATAPGGNLTTKDLCRLLGERLHMLPPFTWKLVNVPFGIDLPYWIEDPDFDLDFHIRESAVPPPGDRARVAETVARIFARPLDRSRPLWELYLIHGLENGRAALLTKVHHSVVDGVSGAEILSVLLDPSPEGREIPPAPKARRKSRQPGEIEMLGRALAGLPLQPVRALKAAPGSLLHLTEIPGANAFPVVPTISRALMDVRRRIGGGGPQDPSVLEITTARPPRTRFNGRISAHRRFAYGSLPLADVKAVKDALGVTVNDVVVTLCTTAVRNWLIARDDLPEDPLVAMVPVSVRTEEEKGTFGNRISAMTVPVPTNVADPTERLLRAHQLLRSAKELHKATPASLLTDAASFIPPAVAARAARTTVEVLGRTRPPLNLVISNVPGPRVPLYCAGARLEGHFPVSVVVDGVGLNMTVMSYRDHVDFGIIADRDQIDDTWELLAGVEEAMAELLAVVGQPSVGEGRNGARKAAAQRAPAATS